MTEKDENAVERIKDGETLPEEEEQTLLSYEEYFMAYDKPPICKDCIYWLVKRGAPGSKEGECKVTAFAAGLRKKMMDDTCGEWIGRAGHLSAVN